MKYFPESCCSFPKRGENFFAPETKLPFCSDRRSRRQSACKQPPSKNQPSHDKKIVCGLAFSQKGKGCKKRIRPLLLVLYFRLARSLSEAVLLIQLARTARGRRRRRNRIQFPTHAQQHRTTKQPLITQTLRWRRREERKRRPLPILLTPQFGRRLRNI